MIYFASKEEINKDLYYLKGVFKEQEKPDVIQKKYYITYSFEKKEAFIFLGEKSKYKKCHLEKTIKKIIDQNKKGFNINFETFTNHDITLKNIIKSFTSVGIYETHVVWNKKTGKNKSKSKKDIYLIGPEKFKNTYAKYKIEANNINIVRDFQMMPHNLLNSELYAKYIKRLFVATNGVQVHALTKEEIEAEGMGLLLGVNAGSAYKPQCILINYKGDASSNEHIVFVGKGITFDSGGMNIKPGRYMNDMKFDMSGSAIVAGAIKTIADLRYKTNVTALLMVTDNMISNKAIKPDDVLTASNGMTVEINNTDAEGRLVLADGLVYAWKRLKATKLVDVSTLTGAMLVSLGSTFTGAWSTNDNEFAKIQEAANEANEKIWRMPFHNDFLKYMKKSKVADLRNTDYTGGAGSASAAMFLKEFTNNLPYIHLDVAGSAEVGGQPTGVMIKTLANYAKSKDE